MKLVITGHDPEGKSVFHHAGEPSPGSSPGSYELWATRGPQRVPDPTAADRPAGQPRSASRRPRPRPTSDFSIGS